VKVLVLDTSAFIMGLDPLGLDYESYSVPEVTEELRQQTGPSYRLTVSSSSGKLKIQSPTEASLDAVSENAKQLGDKIALSKADTCVIALALDLKNEGNLPIIVSDDYAIQNVAEGIGIAYQSLATLGIRQRFSWTSYCPACFRRYPAGNIQECLVCGTKLKRKPLQRQTTRKSDARA
jgi:UPF0271 protein